MNKALQVTSGFARAGGEVQFASVVRFSPRLPQAAATLSAINGSVVSKDVRKRTIHTTLKIYLLLMQ